MAAGDHVVLVGLMGAGKSTIGRALATRLDRTFVDADAELESLAWQSIPELFNTKGEDEFRRLETQVLADLLARPEPLVVASGGGAVERAINRELLASTNVVWLKAELATLLERLGDGVGRPLLAGGPALVLTNLASRRDPLYREVADLIVETDHADPELVAAQIGGWVLSVSSS